MTTNRLLTSIVQLALVIPTAYLVRLMWHDLKQDVREVIKDFR